MPYSTCASLTDGVTPLVHQHMLLWHWLTGLLIFTAIQVSIMWCIFSNLSRRKAGDTRPSAYSIFNPGVQRLPGQLDADQIDGEIRQGRMG